MILKIENIDGKLVVCLNENEIIKLNPFKKTDPELIFKSLQDLKSQCRKLELSQEDIILIIQHINKNMLTKHYIDNKMKQNKTNITLYLITFSSVAIAVASLIVSLF